MTAPPTRSGLWNPDRSFWQSRSVAITGATGFLGSHLIASLVDLGAAVVILTRDDVPPSSISAAWLEDVAVVHGSIEDQATVERFLGDYEAKTLFHLAAQSQVGVANRNPVATLEANVRGTWVVLEGAHRSPHVEQVITASTDKAYGTQPVMPIDETMPLRAINPYDVSKACADLIAQSYHAAFGLSMCIMRCCNLFGPADRNWGRLVPGTIRALLRNERPVIRSDGTMVRDYLYVVDGVRAYLQLTEAMAANPSVIGEAYNLSSERPLSVLELVALLQDAAGTSLEPDIRATATHEIDRQFLSAAKARAAFGFEPCFSFEEALAETVAWYGKHMPTEAGEG